MLPWLVAGLNPPGFGPLQPALIQAWSHRGKPQCRQDGFDSPCSSQGCPKWFHSEWMNPSHPCSSCCLRQPECDKQVCVHWNVSSSWRVCIFNICMLRCDWSSAEIKLWSRFSVGATFHHWIIISWTCVSGDRQDIDWVRKWLECVDRGEGGELHW